MPKISVIIPVYNTAKYIEKCLESLKNQEMNDIEVIIVNDGSTDNSEKIIKEYIEKNKKLFLNEITYLKKENGGLSDARNFGIQYVRGKYIAFLDSDDYLENTLFLKLEKYIEQEIDLIKFKMTTVDEDCNKMDVLDGPIFDKCSGEEAFQKLCVEEKFLEVACIYLYRTEFFKENNFQYKVGAYHEDFGLTPLIIMKASSVVSTEFAEYYYMQTNNSITRNDDYNKTVKKAKDVLEHYDHMVKTVECYEISENSKTLIKRYYTNTVLLKLEGLEGNDKKKYIKEIRRRKVYKNIKVTSLKQFVKKQLVKVSPKMYLNMR